MIDEPTAARVGRLLGAAVAAARPVSGGYSIAVRSVVGLVDGRTAFVKLASTDDTADYLRAEHRAYTDIAGSFMPELLAWDDDGHRPLLVIEDLSGRHWPPPWRAGDVEAVRAALAEVAATAPPAWAESAEASRDDLSGGETWRPTRSPCSHSACALPVLEAHLDELSAAAARAQLDGHALLHFDVRSDNLCLHDGRAVLVDWNWTMRGNPQLELAGWLPSLHAEGGPMPETILPDAPQLAALVAGYFAAQAGLPPIEAAPHVREVQRSSLATALPWAARALRLEPPGEVTSG